MKNDKDWLRQNNAEISDSGRFDSKSGLETAQQRNRDLWRDENNGQAERLTSKELPQGELKRVAKESLPERFHDLVRKSEVLAVYKAETYNREKEVGRSSEQKSAGKVDAEYGVQKTAKETGGYNVVELKLGDKLECGQAHGLSRENTGQAHYGFFFSEYISVARTSGEVREEFVIPPRSNDKTHGTWGCLLPGAVVVISEMSPSTLTFKDGQPVSKSAEMKTIDSPTPDQLPPLGKSQAVAAYQIELKGGKPSEFFRPNDMQWRENDHRFKRDLWH